MNLLLDFDQFVANRNEGRTPEISVMVAKTVFMLAPEGEEMDLDFNIAYHLGRWWLVSNALAESGGVSKLSLAKLYPAMRADGSLFLLPVTYPFVDAPDTWYNAWQEITEVARHRWVKVVSNKAEGRHEYQEVALSVLPQWPDLSFREWVAHAFSGSVMTVAPSAVVHEMPKRRSGSLAQI
jgi:hypothetical protein